jgi:hypothetical protein
LSYAATNEEISAQQAKMELSELIVAMVRRQGRSRPTPRRSGTASSA